MNLFEIPKWETDAAGEAQNHNLFKFGSGKAKKKKNASKVTSLVDTDFSRNKNKTKNGLMKKLVNLKTNSLHKESEDVKHYETSAKKTKSKHKSKNLSKANKGNNASTENKLEPIGKSFVAAPVSDYIKKQKKKKNRFKKMTNEDSVLSSEINLLPSKGLNYSENPDPNACKTTPKKRKRLPSESAVPLLKSISSEERIKPAKQRKLNDEINTPIRDTSAYTMGLQKSPYSIQKLKEIFAKTPPSSHEKKNSVASTLRERMMQKLQASRFRYLNEQLYTSEPKEAQELFRSDPEAFQAYHEGYQKQVQRWPINPLDVIIKSLKKKPSELVIADFGCGDAQLARSLPNKVHSFDLIALSDEVIECNMTHTPLSNASVDVVVFCLSLMGTSLKEFLNEANRVLKEGGLMKIAEVESRFDNVQEFIAKLHKYGFACTWKDLSHNLFYFLDFKKERNISKKMKKKLPELTLKPCLYKKR